MRDGERDAEDGVGAERRLVGGGVQVEHRLVDQALLGGVVADQLRADLLDDGEDGLLDALAAVAARCRRRAARAPRRRRSRRRTVRQHGRCCRRRGRPRPRPWGCLASRGSRGLRRRRWTARGSPSSGSTFSAPSLTVPPSPPTRLCSVLCSVGVFHPGSSASRRRRRAGAGVQNCQGAAHGRRMSGSSPIASRFRLYSSAQPPATFCSRRSRRGNRPARTVTRCLPPPLREWSRSLPREARSSPAGRPRCLPLRTSRLVGFLGAARASRPARTGAAAGPGRPAPGLTSRGVRAGGLAVGRSAVGRAGVGRSGVGRLRRLRGLGSPALRRVGLLVRRRRARAVVRRRLRVRRALAGLVGLIGLIGLAGAIRLTGLAGSSEGVSDGVSDGLRRRLGRRRICLRFVVVQARYLDLQAVRALGKALRALGLQNLLADGYLLAAAGQVRPLGVLRAAVVSQVSRSNWSPP